MKIAVLTEGVSEYRALPLLYGQINARTSHQLLKPLKVNVAPDAPPGVIARECKSRLIIAAAQGASLAVIVLDREQQQLCPGRLSSDIEAAVAQTCSALPARVVLKDRMFENWLVADLSALAAQRKRFAVTPAMQRKVQPNKADTVDAAALIKSAVVSGEYDKVKDAERICSLMRIEVAAAHSRSLRHLLHVVQDPAFLKQCRLP